MTMYVRLSLRPSVCRSPMLKPRSRLPDDVITNPRWRTAANIKKCYIGTSQWKRSDYDEVWYTESDRDCDSKKPSCR